MPATHLADTAEGRRYIEEHGGTITHTRYGYETDFDDPYESALAKIAAHEEHQQEAFEAGLERARLYGTEIVPLVRPRGEGWYAATSHTYPGCWRVCQIDPESGEVLYCDCEWWQARQAGLAFCHHGALALATEQDLFYARLAPYLEFADMTPILSRSLEAVHGR